MCERKIGSFDCCSVIEGDCLELMKELPDGCVDAVITDPPYNVGLEYSVTGDNRKDYAWFVLDALREYRRLAPLVMLTTGMRNLWLYPKADWVMCWAKPGSCSRSDMGGFNEWEPVLIYGKRRIFNDFIYLPNCVNYDSTGETGSHPCPKHLRLMEKLVMAGADE